MKKGFNLIEVIILLSIMAFVFIFLIPVFSKAGEVARSVSCISNQKQIGTATMMWVQDHNYKLPDGDVWSKLGLSGKTLKCPIAKYKGNTYGYSKILLGKKLEDFFDPMGTLMTTDARKNLTENILASYDDIDFRHSTKNAVIACYLDTHVVKMKKKSFDEFSLANKVPITIKDTNIKIPKASKAGGIWYNQSKSISVTVDSGFDNNNVIADIILGEEKIVAYTKSSSMTIVAPLNTVIDSTTKEWKMTFMLEQYVQEKRTANTGGIILYILDSNNKKICELKVINSPSEDQTQNGSWFNNDSFVKYSDYMRKFSHKSDSNLSIICDKNESTLKIYDDKIITANTLEGNWSDPKKIVIVVPGYKLDDIYLKTAIRSITISQID